MNSIVISHIDDIGKQMNGYTVLLNFKYINLCVKADAMSLLPVTVADEGREYEIEEVADVSVANDSQILVYPKYSEMLPKIMVGITAAHPEFKMSIKKGEMTIMPDEEAMQYREKKQGAEPEEIDQIPEGSLDDGPAGLFLVYTMPEVDKERRDLLKAAVKSLHAECMERIDTVYFRNAELIVNLLVHTPVKEADRLKDTFEQQYKSYKRRADSLRDDKLQEIDEAYARYTLKQKDIEAQKDAEAENMGYNVTQSMVLE